MFYWSTRLFVCTTAILVFLMSSASLAADWGGIKGRFVVAGTPPKPAPLVVTKDQFCIDKMPTNGGSCPFAPSNSAIRVANTPK